MRLLAGLFGAAMTAVLAVVPGAAVADVGRIGVAEIANVAAAGGSAAAITSRGRRPAPPGRTFERAAAAGAAHADHRDATATRHDLAAIPAVVGRPAIEPSVATVIADRHEPARSSAVGTVRLRGPPSIAGS